MRKISGLNRQSTALLDHDDVDETSGESYRSSRLGDRLSDRQTPVPKRALRRVTTDDYDDESDAGFLRTQTRIRVRRGLIPESLWGKIAGGFGLFLTLCAMVAGMLVVRSFLLHDPRFLIDSSADIQIDGNSHVSRPQLLSIFGEDIGRNLFYVSLKQRRAELETLPWVEHATVMRLLPNRLRVSVVERTPVAFVRQDGRIGLVDAYGMLLDLPDDDPAGAKYSFPVLTGISAADPLSTRAARMKIYQQFIQELDSSGVKLSESLSEVDVSNPEDVKALIPDHTSEILVHFGDEDFLNRYQRYQQQLPAWRAQYPNLASADMRYPNQVVLDMTPGTDASANVPDVNAPAANSSAAPAPAATVSVPAVSVPPAPPTNPASGKRSAAMPMAPAAPVTPAKAPVAKAPVAQAIQAKAPAPKVVPTKSAPVPAKALSSHGTAPVATAKPSKTPATKPPVAKALAKTTPLKSPVAKITPADLPPPAKLKLAPSSDPKPAALPPVAALPSMQTTTQPSLQHPLTQSFDVPAKKKPAAKAAKAKTTLKKKPAMVKSKAKAAAPVKPSAAVAD
jgi:cell division protein FtsQ